VTHFFPLHKNCMWWGKVLEAIPLQLATLGVCPSPQTMASMLSLVMQATSVHCFTYS
jgi:hypothetical protein